MPTAPSRNEPAALLIETANFCFYGVRLDFSSAVPGLARDLAEDLAYFSTGQASKPDITIKACAGAFPRPPAAAALLKTAEYSILKGPAGTRTVWYPEGAVCRYDYRLKSGRITGGDHDLLWELSYLLILSRAGEELEKAGLHRLHAAGFLLNGRGVLMSGPPAAGKSTLLLELLKDQACSLISDDTPLADHQGGLSAFPLRFGLAAGSPHLPALAAGARPFRRRHYPPKHLVSPLAAGAVISPPAGAAYYFRLARNGTKVPSIKPLSAFGAAAELFKVLVLGYGVPQMAEYFLRPDIKDIAAKAGMTFSRLAAAFGLWRRCEFYELELSEDTPLNAARLKDFICRRSARA